MDSEKDSVNHAGMSGDSNNSSGDMLTRELLRAVMETEKSLSKQQYPSDSTNTYRRAMAEKSHDVSWNASRNKREGAQVGKYPSCLCLSYSPSCFSHL